VSLNELFFFGNRGIAEKSSPAHRCCAGRFILGAAWAENSENLLGSLLCWLFPVLFFVFAGRLYGRLKLRDSRP
jgi:hypothetical protein